MSDDHKTCMRCGVKSPTWALDSLGAYGWRCKAPCPLPGAIKSDPGPKQATDPRQRESMEYTGRYLGERRDV